MGITPDTPLSPADANYTPGVISANTAWKENICVVAGDRIELLQFILTPDAAGGGNLRPDGTPGFGAGFMPHWRYTPKWARKQDLNENAFWEDKVGGPGGATKLWRAANGNLGARPVIRVDLDDLYCPWDGEISVEGGTGPLSTPTSTQLVVSYLWDQTHRSRRVAADTRVKYRHRLTFWNPFNADSGAALPIQIPVRADSVWTPDTQQLVLDNGAGTFSSTVTVSGESGLSPVTGFTRVTAVAAHVPCITFGITL
jgi:hypothetical protein